MKYKLLYVQSVLLHVLKPVPCNYSMPCNILCSDPCMQVGNLTIKNVVFAEAIVVNNGLKLDGVLGMAWPINETHDMSAVFQQMIDEKLIDVPVFGFYLNR